MKSPEELEEDRRRHPPIYPTVAPALLKIPGVLGVGVGFKCTRDGQTEDLSLCVIVEKKRSRSELPVSQWIPPSMMGVPTDVQEPVRTVLASDSIVQGGHQIKSDRNGFGTLGCFAFRQNPTKDRVLLSCQHVLYKKAGDRGPGGDVGSPNTSCCWTCKTGDIAVILDGRFDTTVDFGIAKLNGKKASRQFIAGLGPSGKSYADRIEGVAELKDAGLGVKSTVAAGDHVRKVGATTQFTGGTVTVVSDMVPADPESGLGPMEGPFRIQMRKDERTPLDIYEPDDRQDFCQHGDSGAVVVDDRNYIVGLLCRAADMSNLNPPPWMGYGGIAVDIQTVLAAAAAIGLPITIPTTDQYGYAEVTKTGALIPGMPILGTSRLGAEDLVRREALERLKQELRSFPLGLRLVEAIERHHAEIMHLIQHHRVVKVAWHRSRGPEFVARMGRGMQDLEQPIPTEIDGTAVGAGVTAISEAFTQHGSEALVEDLRSLTPPVRSALSNSTTLRGLLDNLRRVDAHV